VFNALKALTIDDGGATMVEYGIMVALIAAVCIAVVGLIGQNVNTAFSSVSNQL